MTSLPKDIPESVKSGETYPNVAAHFDRIAPLYEEGSDKVGWKGPEVLFEAIQPLLPINRPLKLVDLGAGTGRIGRLVKGFNPQTHVTGVDVSSGMLAVGVAEKRIDTALTRDVTDLAPIESKSCDAVTSAGVLDFIADTKAFVSEAARILKAGGILAITFERGDSAFPGHKTLAHDEAVMKALLEANGLRITHHFAVPEIYTNFKTGNAVENMVMVGILKDS